MFISTENYGVFLINFNEHRTVLGVDSGNVTLAHSFGFFFYELRKTWKDLLKCVLLLCGLGVVVLL